MCPKNKSEFEQTTKSTLLFVSIRKRGRNIGLTAVPKVGEKDW